MIQISLRQTISNSINSQLLSIIIKILSSYSRHSLRRQGNAEVDVLGVNWYSPCSWKVSANYLHRLTNNVDKDAGEQKRCGLRADTSEVLESLTPAL